MQVSGIPLPRRGDLRWLGSPNIGRWQPQQPKNHPPLSHPSLQHRLGGSAHPCGSRHPPRVPPQHMCQAAQGLRSAMAEMELIREAEWIITCFLKRGVCSRLLWSGLFIGWLYNRNNTLKFRCVVQGQRCWSGPEGVQIPPLMLPRPPQPLCGCSSTFRSNSPA